MSGTSGTEAAVDTKARIGVLGTGVMGVQICTVLLKAGYDVVLKTRSPERMERSRERITSSLLKSMPEDEARTRLMDLRLTVSFQDLADRDIIIEAVKEDAKVKRDNLEATSSVMRDDALVFSNSSSMSMDELSNYDPGKENFLGFHVFNPFEKMRLVEIVVTKSTGPSAIAAAFHLAESLGKSPVLVKDSPGYVVNRLLFLQINEAVRLLEEGISTREDIDQAMRLGLNHPLGPLELADLIGLDTCLSILRILEKDLGNASYRPGDVLGSLVAQGHLGRKSGKGFYDYPRK